jgi:hypothetical protein
MKQRILLAIIAGIFSSVVAAQSPTPAKIVNGPAFERLNISGPVTVELLESEEPSVELQGDMKFINEVSISWSKKELFVHYFGPANPRNLVIRIFINKLTYMHAEEGASVFTPHPLFTSPNLKVSVKDEESMAKIMSFGKIIVPDLGYVKVRRTYYSKK